MDLRLSIGIGGLFFFAILESLHPARRAPLSRIARWSANLPLPLLSQALLFLIAPLGAIGTAVWARQHDVGLLPRLALPDLADLLCGVLLLDLGLWMQHVAMHRVPWLWRLHRVHHTDPHLDVTSAARFHPVEIAFSVGWVSLLALLIGPSAEAIVTHGILVGAFAQFNHANLALPWSLEPVANRIVATPTYHRVHHSVVERETNANFGNILSLWDALAGLRISPTPSHDRGLRLGLIGWRRAGLQNLWQLLIQPFGRASARQANPSSGTDSR